MSDRNAPNFAAWSMDNLVKFCNESYQRLQENGETIQQLQTDLKDAISAYRQLMLRHEDDGR